VVPDLAVWLKERSLLTALIQQQLVRAQTRMKSQADKGRSERQFKEGDMVYLKLQPHVQTSVATRSCQKLAFKFYGTIKVLKKVGLVAYKLELPASVHIHLVVHVSQLKQHVPTQAIVGPDLPSTESCYDHSDYTSLGSCF